MEATLQRSGGIGLPKGVPDWVERAEELREQGCTGAEIAEALGVDKGQVYYRLAGGSAARDDKVICICPDCGRTFERRKNRIGTGKCTPCAQRHRPLRVVQCAGCGETFETKEQDQRYCGRRCYRKHVQPTPGQLDRAAAIGRKRIGEKNPNFRHGKRAGENERRLTREFNLEKKGEVACRNCGSHRFIQAHHAVPRSKSRAGKYDLRNCLPLCATCHTSWHQRAVVIYRDLFTEEEWAFVSRLATPGWLDERYPDRGREFRDPEREVVVE